MAVTIWCPKCAKKYTLPERDGLAKKRVRCKKCEHRFYVGEAIESGAPTNRSTDIVLAEATAPIKPPAANPQVLELDEAPPRSPHVTVDSSSMLGPAVDMSQYFLASSSSSSSARPSTTHVKNPMMILAVLGAIGLSLMLALVSGAFRINSILAHNRAAEEMSQPDFASPEVPTARAENRPPPEVPPFNAVLPPSFPELIPPKIDEVESSIQQQLEIERQVARDLYDSGSQGRAGRENAKRAVELEKKRMADTEARQSREKRRLEEQKERAQARVQRSKIRRVADELKVHLKTLEDEADKQPLNGLVSRIPVKGWGARSLVIGDKSLVFIGFPDGLSVYDLKKNKYVFDSKRSGGVECLALNPKGTLLAAGGSEGGIELFKVGRSGKLKSQRKLDKRSKPITHLAFSPDGSRLVSVDRQNKIVFRDTKKGSAIKSQKHFEKEIVAIRAEEASSQIRFADRESWAVFDFDDGELFDSGTYPFRLDRTAVLLPDSNKILQASGSRLQLLELQQRDPVLAWKGNGVQWKITCFGGDRVLTGGSRHVYEWSAVDGSLKRVWAIPDAGYIQKIAISPDEKRMAVSSGSARQDVYVFDL